MKKHYIVNYNGQELAFNHHDEVAEEIREYYKSSLLYHWAEKWQGTFEIGEAEFLITDLIESWTGYPSNTTGNLLHEQLENSVYNDYFADSINKLIEGNSGIEKINFPHFDFSIIVKKGEI